MIRIVDVNGQLKVTTNQQFRDNIFAVTGSSDLTKRVVLDVDTNVPTATTVQLAISPVSGEIQLTHAVVSANWQATNHGAYTAIATSTATDPAVPAAGHEFTTIVRNGTITIGPTSYSDAGLLVRRIWHSGSWTNYPYPHLNGAWTWTAAQTIDRGTGALPALPNPTHTALALYNPDGLPIRITSRSYAANGLSLEPLVAEGTRSAPTAVADTRSLWQVVPGGYDGTAWQSTSAWLRVIADGGWSGSNRGTYLAFDGTPSGSTARAEWFRVQNAMFTIGGIIPAASGGSLQLGTGSANGIGFQTGGVVDTKLFRHAAAAMTLNDNGAGADVVWRVSRTSGASLETFCTTGNGYIGTTTSHPTILRSNNADRMNLKTTGQVRFLPLSADPGGAETGDVYYNSTTNKLRVYNGAWVDLH